MQVMAQVEHVEPQQHQLYYLAGKLKEQDISQKVLKLMLYHAAKPNLLLKLPLLYLINNSKSYYNQGYAHGIADGLDKVDVKYIYHEHSGDSTTGTGCYTVAEYHKHTDSCYKTVQTGTRKCGTWNCYNNHTPYADFRCSGCGAEAKNQWVGDTSSSGWGMGDHMVPIYSKQLNCTKGDEIIGYQLGCGKTEESCPFRCG